MAEEKKYTQHTPDSIKRMLATRAANREKKIKTKEARRMKAMRAERRQQSAVEPLLLPVRVSNGHDYEQLAKLIAAVWKELGESR